MLKSTKKGTFLIKILDQQHGSWQGTITWISTNEQKNFRSVFELLQLIDGALKEETPDSAQQGLSTEDQQ